MLSARGWESGFLGIWSQPCHRLTVTLGKLLNPTFLSLSRCKMWKTFPYLTKTLRDLTVYIMIEPKGQPRTTVQGAVQTQDKRRPLPSSFCVYTAASTMEPRSMLGATAIQIILNKTDKMEGEGTEHTRLQARLLSDQ